MDKTTLKTEIRARVKEWACPYLAMYRRGKYSVPDMYESYFVHPYGEMLDIMFDMVDAEEEPITEYDFSVYNDRIYLLDPELFVCIPEKNLIPMSVQEIEIEVSRMFFEDPHIRYFKLKHKDARSAYEIKMCNIDICLGDVCDRVIQYVPIDEFYPVEVNKDDGYIRIVEAGMGEEYIIVKNRDMEDDSELEILDQSSTKPPIILVGI